MQTLPARCRGRLPKREFIVRKDNTSCADCQIYLAVVAVRFIFRGNRRPYGIPPPPVLLRHALFPRHAESLPSSAMSVPFGTPLLSRPIAAIGLPAALPCIVSRPGLFPDIRPVSTLLMTDYPLLYLPCPGIPFLGIRPSPSLLVPSCPVSSLLCIPCFRPRPCRSFFWEAGDFGMKMRNTSLFGK